MRIVQRFFSVMFLLILVGVFMTQTSVASTHVFKPEDHSVYIDQRDPDLNKSDKAGILTASTLDENARIVIHFDLGTVITDPASITQAKLYLYHYRGGGYTGTRQLNVYPLTTGFDETTATWNFPWTTYGGDYDNSVSASADVPEAWENWVELDVTNLLKNRWSEVTNYGFLIRDPLEDDTGDGPYVRFRSHRYVDEAPTELPYLEINTDGTSVEESDGLTVHSLFSLSQNFPNPFNNTTLIQFALNRSSQVSLTIYNIRGQRVKTIIDEYQGPGNHAASWDGTNIFGESVSSGIYLYRLQSDYFSETKRLLYLK